VIEPQPNAETVEALLDTAWRVAGSEAARTDALDRKASTVATFASLVVTLTATLGLRFVERFETWWALTLFVAGILALVLSVGMAVAALFPREYLSLGIAYLKGFRPGLRSASRRRRSGGRRCEASSRRWRASATQMTTRPGGCGGAWFSFFSAWC
jgi:hypothetical protein